MRSFRPNMPFTAVPAADEVVSKQQALKNRITNTVEEAYFFRGDGLASSSVIDGYRVQRVAGAGLVLVTPPTGSTLLPMSREDAENVIFAGLCKDL